MPPFTPPTLPADCPDPGARKRGLDEARAAYRYDRSYGDLPFVESLPRSEEFSPRYAARGVEVKAEIEANRAAGTAGAAARSALPPGGDALEPWAKMYPLLPEPASVAVWRHDWAFAWQRVAGPVPVVLARVEALPPWLPVGDGDLQRAVGRGDATLAGALARGRLYAADYALFDGVPAGVTDGRQKYLWAPVALFVAEPSAPGGLLPVAIQAAGRGGGRGTLYTPADPDWLLARAAVQVADENFQGVVVHLGWCHLVTQTFLIAARRQLSADHPLLRLLAPHFEHTLAVNQVARTTVVSAGGTQDRLLAPTIEAQLTTLNASLRGLDYASLDPRAEAARRGVDDAGALPHYPFRDDGLLLWGAIRAFVEGYVRRHYADDAAVRGDGELAAWVREVGAADGGRLPGLVAGAAPATVSGTAELVARVIFRATAYHAGINDSSYDWVGHAPNMPTAGFAPLPPRGTGSPADLARMLPPARLAWESIAATRQVAALHLNRLGDYPPELTADPQVRALVERFQADLSAAEATIATRNAARPLPYEYLLPGRITASINA